MSTENPTLSKTTFCPLPWTLFSAQPSGIMRVCSPGHSSPDRGVLRKENGDLFRVATDSIVEARNAELLKRVRQNMLAGIETPEVCQRCIKEESAGLVSRRKLEAIKNKFSEQDARQITEADGELKNPERTLRTLDLRFGNICNLRCRMCWPGASSAWYQEYFETRFKRFSDGDRKYNLQRLPNNRVELEDDIYAWPQSTHVWEQLRTVMDGIQELHFSGGEPLLIEEHTDFLNDLVAQGRASQITLDYNTNLTILPERLLDLWGQFKKVSIGVSIDGFDKVNDYIRYPSKFSKIEANLDRLDTTGDNIEVYLTPTVQALNVYYFTDLLKWLITKNYRKINQLPPYRGDFLFLSGHALSSPAYLGIQILPKEVKEQVEKKFAEFLIWHTDFLNSLSLSEEGRQYRKKMAEDTLSGYIRLMKSQDRTDLLKDFWREMSLSDQHRKQDIRIEMPEIGLPIEQFLKAGISPA